MIVVALQAGLTHDQFWDMTPHEVSLSLRAHARNLEARKRLLAWVQANILGGLVGKKAPSVNKLMGATSIMGMSASEIKEHYRSKGVG